MTMGQKIYQLRMSKKLSQEQLAFDLDVARQTISKWETDAVQPTTENIQLLCRYFQVDPNSIFDTQVIEKFDTSNIASSQTNNKTEIAVTVDENKVKKHSKGLTIFLVIMLSSIFVFSLIIGIICTVIFTQPQDGYGVVQYSRYNWALIVCFGLAIIALISLLVVIIFVVKNKKEQKSLKSDKNVN